MATQTYNENHRWTSGHTWCELYVPSCVKAASSMNKTVAGKRRSPMRICKYQSAKANRGEKSPLSSHFSRWAWYGWMTLACRIRGTVLALGVFCTSSSKVSTLTDVFNVRPRCLSPRWRVRSYTTFYASMKRCVSEFASWGNVGRTTAVRIARCSRLHVMWGTLHERTLLEYGTLHKRHMVHYMKAELSY